MSHRITLDDGTHLTLPTARLSFTQVSMYLKCPKQYYHRYVEGKKSPPGVALVEGSAHHEAFEASNLHQIKTGDPLSGAKAYEVFADTFSDKRKEVEDWGDTTAPGGKATADFVTKRGKIIQKTFATDVAPDYVPVAAERAMTVSARGVPLIAYTDMETKLGIFDYKVSKSNSPYFRQGSAESSLQLSIYAKGSGKSRVGYIGMLKDKPDQYKLAEATRGPGDWAYAEEIIVGVAKAISAGAFPMCGPEQFLCNPKWCGYWSQCRGKLLGNAPADKVSVTVPKIKVAAKKRKAPPRRRKR